MKKWLLFTSCLVLVLSADEPSQNLWDYHPIHGGVNAIYIGPADVTPRKSDTEDGRLTYWKSNAFLTMLVPINRYSYFFPRVEWNTFNVGWNQNPKFNRETYNYIQFALTFYSTQIEKWRWILRGEYNLDTGHFSKPRLYGLFTGFVWGAYEIHRKWHYHVGILGYTGMRGQEIYPVIGFDYAPNKTWLFQFVFPINYSIEYNLNKAWRLSLKGRPLKERFRTGPGEPQPRSVFSYSSMGAEFNVHYEIPWRLQVEAFAGYNFGGSFYIKDKNNHNALYTDISGAPYGGANIDIGF